MPYSVTLSELANLSIGTPEIGAVNFNALHALIHAIIRHLKIQDVKTEISDDEKDFFKPLMALSQLQEGDKEEFGELIRVPIGYEQLDRKITDIAKQIDVLNKWPTATDLLERSKEIPAGSPVGELWHMMQMKRNIESNADGISKAMNLMQDLVNEINMLKQFQEKREDEFQTVMKDFLLDQPNEIQKQRGELDDQRMKLATMHQALDNLDEKLSQYPPPNEVNNMVRWEILQDTLLTADKRKKLKPKEDIGAEPEDASRSSKTSLPSTRKIQPSSSSQALQAKPHKAKGAQHPSKGAPAKHVAQQSPRQAAQQPASADQAGPGAQQLVTGAQEFPTETPTGPGAQQVPTGAPAGPEASPSATGLQFGPESQQADTGIPGGPGAQQLPMGIPFGPEAQQFPMGIPSGPGAPQVPMGIPYGPGAPQVPMGIPYGPGALQVPMGIPYGPGAPQVPMGIPYEPGAPQVPMGIPYGPGAQQFPMGFPYGPGAQQFPMGFPYGPGAQQFPMGFPYGPGTQQPVGPVDQQFDIGTIIEPEAQPTGPGSLSSVGSPGGPGTPVFAPAGLGTLSPTMEIHEGMPCFYEVEPQIQEGGRPSSETKPPPGSPAPSSLHSKIKSAETVTASSPSSRLSSATVRFMETVDALRQIGQVAKLYGNLKEQVDDLYMIKADRSELFRLPALQGMQSLQGLQGMQNLQGLQELPGFQGLQLSEADIPRLTSDVLEQLASLKDLKEDLQENKQMDGELQKHCQEVILQLQDECEKLNSTTRNLIEDHNEKQKQIDLLYQSLEKLDEKKADKEQMELDFDSRATKNALESKVSRSQFDATAEQLNVMIQDLLNKVTGQEQDWHKVVDKISFEMENKLDRMELDPFRKLLEDRWKSIRKQLKERSPTYDLDDAAGIRKQLIARFHCISCDRPVDMAVPGPPILTIPNIPGLPGHRSNRPYTVYELEQVRQHSRNMKSGITYARYEAVQMEKSINQLRRLHTCLRKEIEKVQAHFGGSMRASTQTIKEMLQSRCLNLGQHRKRLDSKTIVDRVPEVMMDQSAYLSNRSCGGSHTLTFPHRRYTRLQNVTQYSLPGEEENIPSVVKGEVDILGMDGQIYKGRLDPRFPPIGGKETMQPKNKAKPQTPPKALTPIDPNSLSSRSQSAKMACRSPSSTGLGKNGKDRPTGSQLIDNLEVRIDVPIHRISSEETALS
uniref:Glutamine-rich protein 2 isoform X3 n=1 Tax=Geotrypetes seraphini TaxID=260995 RepID=A0A6P8SEP4_GEOSA|nr:glutamine-rich protein 2 isoform X3 [Geotrypetes seraphini]